MTRAATPPGTTRSAHSTPSRPGAGPAERCCSGNGYNRPEHGHTDVGSRMSSNSLTLAPAPRSEAAEQVRAEVREFLAAELAAGTFRTHVDTWLSGVDPDFSRKLGSAAGWA
ncbi:hypothetical protein [Blastococcus brunescens]|uniref:Acyl-CoA dehydrogenase/oxidase N-terminal domain-containing protein n=1 Tax=Blastococcus brunescens TaxID=1564165 RepID=A0ABZ1AY07_9ACTN|nr:hypothetical protein [Blastococcus sp. BMG 8361]WRL62303.1 hypothetical protein U6N30_20000 [Blastococcus sp. BMG 8361]